MKYGARNQLEGKMVEIVKGDVMSKTKVEIPAGSIMCSVMTSESLEELNIKKGDTVKVIAKAVNVLLVSEK